jgi:hypothetical protein
MSSCSKCGEVQPKYFSLSTIDLSESEDYQFYNKTTKVACEHIFCQDCSRSLTHNCPLCKKYFIQLMKSDEKVTAVSEKIQRNNIFGEIEIQISNGNYDLVLEWVRNKSFSQTLLIQIAELFLERNLIEYAEKVVDEMNKPSDSKTIINPYKQQLLEKISKKYLDLNNLSDAERVAYKISPDLSPIVSFRSRALYNVAVAYIKRGNIQKANEIVHNVNPYHADLILQAISKAYFSQDPRVNNFEEAMRAVKEIKSAQTKKSTFIEMFKVCMEKNELVKALDVVHEISELELFFNVENVDFFTRESLATFADMEKKDLNSSLYNMLIQLVKAHIKLRQFDDGKKVLKEVEVLASKEGNISLQEKYFREIATLGSELGSSYKKSN